MVWSDDADGVGEDRAVLGWCGAWLDGCGGMRVSVVGHRDRVGLGVSV